MRYIHVQTSRSKKKKRQKRKTAIQLLQDENVLYADKLTVKLLDCKCDTTSPWCTCPELSLRLDVSTKYCATQSRAITFW